MTIYSKDGRLIIPISERKNQLVTKSENKVRYIISQAYCPNGCDLIDHDNQINGYPGLRIKYKRPGVEGEFIISAIEGDFDKKILSGSLIDKVKDELYCPHCGIIFPKLVNCNCQPDADMIIIGLTSKLNYNDAITFCNVTGCANGAFIQSGDAIRHVRLRGSV